LGYWEARLASKGASILAFDENNIFPVSMRYFDIKARFDGGDNKF
jgi:hypothetical protein